VTPRPEVIAVARNEATEEFFDGTARGEFLLKRCPQGHFSRPQATVCPDCWSTSLDSVPAAGRARLVSWAVVPGRPGDGEPAPEPTIPAIVELEEGPWWWSKLVGADPSGLEEGLALEVAFHRADGGEAVPVFRPA
jgi:uncharacterized OB-fold protein